MLSPTSCSADATGHKERRRGRCLCGEAPARLGGVAGAEVWTHKRSGWSGTSNHTLIRILADMLRVASPQSEMSISPGAWACTGLAKPKGMEPRGSPMYDALSQASMVSPAVQEWLGLVAYRLLGRIGQLFPM